MLRTGKTTLSSSSVSLLISSGSISSASMAMQLMPSATFLREKDTGWSEEGNIIGDG